jgi:hypothetical protein
MKEGSKEGDLEGVAERQGDEVKFFFNLKVIFNFFSFFVI